jgi:hypothetical protein
MLCTSNAIFDSTQVLTNFVLWKMSNDIKLDKFTKGITTMLTMKTYAIYTPSRVNNHIASIQYKEVQIFHHCKILRLKVMPSTI